MSGTDLKRRTSQRIVETWHWKDERKGIGEEARGGNIGRLEYLSKRKSRKDRKGGRITIERRRDRLKRKGERMEYPRATAETLS